MNSLRLLRIVLGLLVLLISVGTEAMAETKDEPRAVAALFSQYETVFYTNTDLSSAFSSFKGLSRQTAGAFSIPFGDLIYGLDLLDPHASADMLAKSEAVLMGGKGFIPAEGEGAAQVSHFCYIVNFGTKGRPNFRKYAAKAHEASMTGEPVWSWQVHSPDPRGQNVTYYAAQIGDSYLLVSNDLGELQAIAKKLTSSDDASTTLSGIRDWEILSQHEYWGYRRVRHDGVVEKDATRLEFSMLGAETAIMFADIKGKTATVRVLGVYANEVVEMMKQRDQQQREAMKRLGMRPFAPPYKFKATDARTLEETFSLSSGEQSEGEIINSMGLFGFEMLI
jgi:hypothetical protein